MILVNAPCVRRCPRDVSEASLMEVEHEVTFDRTDIRISWIYWFAFKLRKENVDLRVLL